MLFNKTENADHFKSTVALSQLKNKFCTDEKHIFVASIVSVAKRMDYTSLLSVTPCSLLNHG